MNNLIRLGTWAERRVGDSYEIGTIDASAAEGGGTGKFFISRLQPGPLVTFNITLGGSADHTDDYTLDVGTWGSTSGSVNLDSGETYKEITVTAADDALIEGPETVVLTLTSVAGGPSNSTITNDTATVIISDNESPVVTIAPTSGYPSSTTNEDDAANLSWTISRTGETTGALEVFFTVSGTATIGDDYTMPNTTSVTIASGQSSAVIEAVVLNDSDSEGDETIIVSLDTDANYTVGTPSSSTITIIDDDSGSTVTAHVLEFSYPLTSVDIILYDDMSQEIGSGTWTGNDDGPFDIVCTFDAGKSCADLYSFQADGIYEYFGSNPVSDSDVCSCPDFDVDF